MECLTKILSKPSDGFIIEQKNKFKYRLFIDFCLSLIFILAAFTIAGDEFKNHPKTLPELIYPFIFTSIAYRGLPVFISSVHSQLSNRLKWEFILTLISFAYLLYFFRTQGVQNGFVWIVFGLFNQFSNVIYDKLKE